ncbi:MAG: hypothetical protein N3D78_01765 [Candidatus Aenigmarchaeota archaeon]|nr:hypothetical protein [Candidatus Aenigmarchaeota archaeon]
MRVLIFWLIAFILSTTFSYAQTSITGADFITLYAGESKTVEYYITNMEAVPQTLSVFISGFYKEGVSLDVYPKILTLQPNQTEKITIYLEAKKFVKEIPPTKFSLNVKYENMIFEKDLILQVLRKHPVYINSLDLSSYGIYPTESVNIITTLENTKNEVSPNYKVFTKIIFEGSEVFYKERITDYIPPSGILRVVETFQTERYQKAGKYEVYVSLYNLKGELVDEAKSAFEVKAIEKIPQNFTRKEVKYSFLEVHVKIEVRNEGNVVSKPFYVIESLPLFMKDFFNPSVQPTEIESSFGQVNYKWLIKPLEPGESVIIEYKISIWQTWLTIVAIIILVLFIFKRTYTPVIRKSVKREGKRLKVFIKVKNSSKKIMKEILVEDFVPTMFKVTSYFGVKPEEVEMKKTKEKKLVWKINELKEDEEAIFGYYLEPIVEILSMRLPAARMEYTDHKGRRVPLFSNELVE